MKTLAKILQEPEVKLKRVIGNLESMSTYSGEDARLLGEISHQTVQKIKSLGLDPADTTPEELHYALMSKLEQDIATVNKSWNLDGASAEKIISLVSAHIKNNQLLVLRGASVKSLLRQNPPKKTMKMLGYRSLESMLKREKHILPIAVSNENDSWLKHSSSFIGGLKTSDFEMRSIEFVTRKNIDNEISATPLAGAIVVQDKTRSSVENFALTVQLLEAVEQMEAESFFLGSNLFGKNFSTYAQQIFNDPKNFLIKIERDDFAHHHHINRLLNDNTPHHQKISQLHPALHWWKSCGHLFFRADQNISFHIRDVLENLKKKSDYESASVEHLGSELRSALLAKYFQHRTFQDYIGSKIDGTLLTLNEIPSPALMSEELEEAFN